MLDNPGFLGASVLFVFFLAIFIGIMVSFIFDLSILFNSRADQMEPNLKRERFIKTLITFLLTVLITILVFWINIRIPRKSPGVNENFGLTESPGVVRATSTLDDS